LRKSHFWRTNLSRGDGCIIQARATPRPCACKFHSYAPAAGGFMPSFICTGATLCISWMGRFAFASGARAAAGRLKYCKNPESERRLIRRVTFAHSSSILPGKHRKHIYMGGESINVRVIRRFHQGNHRHVKLKTTNHGRRRSICTGDGDECHF
jgi:hypothetical protein